MKEDPQLESMLRDLRPGQVPADLRARMTVPAVSVPLWKRLPLPTAIAAAFVLAAGGLWFVMQPPAQDQGSASPIMLHQHRSTLIENRPIEVIEYQGQFWELTEQKWLDEDIALCSATPVRVQLSEIRHELVYQPVRFD